MSYNVKKKQIKELQLIHTVDPESEKKQLQEVDIYISLNQLQIKSLCVYF